jgi:hypothetical protein
VFAITMIESFVAAWAFAWLIQVAIPKWLGTGLKIGRRWREDWGAKRDGEAQSLPPGFSSRVASNLPPGELL